MTRLQLRAIEFIRDFRLEHGLSPTIREIATGLGLKSPGHVYRMIQLLASRGALIHRPRERRSIELIPASPVISVELPAHLYANVQDLARKAKVTPEAVVIEAVRDGFKALHEQKPGFRSANVSKPANRETQKRNAA